MFWKVQYYIGTKWQYIGLTSRKHFRLSNSSRSALRKEDTLLTDLAGLRCNVVTFCSIAAGAWVAVLSLNTHCQPIEHNETLCTQALSDDMPSMHQPNLQPLLPYKMHLLYVIVLFEAHRQQDINSTSVFGQLIPSVHSTTRCYRP